MILNRAMLLAAAPIKNMLTGKESSFGVSHGLSEAGYDIRIAETIEFSLPDGQPEIRRNGIHHLGRFVLASAIEEFQMPPFLVGEVKDKSTWARQGLSVFNTVIEPGWNGFLTLELVFHGNQPVKIPAGTGIAQVLFKRVTEDVLYAGKYQNQPSGPVDAIHRNL